jgi:hypothetical protein
MGVISVVMIAVAICYLFLSKAAYTKKKGADHHLP